MSAVDARHRGRGLLPSDGRRSGWRLRTRRARAEEVLGESRPDGSRSQPLEGSMEESIGSRSRSTRADFGPVSTVGRRSRGNLDGKVDGTLG